VFLSRLDDGGSDDCRIPDPFLGFNEIECQWVNETAWSYRTILPNVDSLDSGALATLVFDGLDTYATVKLNGETILESDNMFIPHRVNIIKQLRLGQQNTLEIDFDSAFQRATAIKDAHPEHEWVGFNGDMARLAARKAQYHWYLFSIHLSL
jgi:beta-mannosidase